MVLLETYSEVHTGFRQLWSELNGGRLDLEIVCPGSWDSRNPPDSFRSEDIIGKIRVPLNEGLSVFSPWAQPIQIDSLGVQPTQISAFVELCRSAGALLPSIRKSELRLYCDWDSRRPEELWIANLLHLTKKYSQARLNIDVIQILKPVEFSLEVINAWMDDGLIPDKPPKGDVLETAILDDSYFKDDGNYLTAAYCVKNYDVTRPYLSKYKDKCIDLDPPRAIKRKKIKIDDGEKTNSVYCYFRADMEEIACSRSERLAR